VAQSAQQINFKGNKCYLVSTRSLWIL